MDKENSVINGSKTDIEGSNSAISREVGGNHYKKLKIQPIEFITANNLDFIDGNIIMYTVSRKDVEDDKERYDKIILFCQLAKETKCG